MLRHGKLAGGLYLCVQRSRGCIGKIINVNYCIIATPFNTQKSHIYNFNQVEKGGGGVDRKYFVGSY